MTRTLPSLALVLAVLACAAPPASAGLAVQPIRATALGQAQVQVTGTPGVDLVTMERIDRTTRFRITANRPIAASEGCTATGPRTADCVTRPVAVDPIMPDPAVVFFGAELTISLRLGGGADEGRFLRNDTIPFEGTEVAMFGGPGDDLLSVAGLRAGVTGQGGIAHAILFGDDGNDVLVGGRVSDLLQGDGGDDVVRGGAGGDRMGGGSGDDALIGGDGIDELNGGTADDVLVGDAGEDRLIGAAGADLLSGGTERDTVQYQEFRFVLDESTPAPFDGRSVPVARAGVRVRSGDGSCTDGGPEDEVTGVRAAPIKEVSGSCGGRLIGGRRDEVLGDVEIVVGTLVSDVLIGGPADETLFGDRGDDQLEGGGGTDSLLGDVGNDKLLLRDGATDLGALCGAGTGDQVFADADDPVDATCELVDRGSPTAPTATGGASVPPPPPPPPGRRSAGRATAAQAPAGRTATEVTVVESGGDVRTPSTARPVTVEDPTPAGSPPTGRHTGGPGPGGGDGGRRTPDAVIVSRVVDVDRRGRARVLLTCLYFAKTCRGTVQLRAKRGKVLGRAVVDVPWGTSATVPVRLPRGARGARMKVRALVAVRDSEAGRGAAVRRLRRTVTLTGR